MDAVPVGGAGTIHLQTGHQATKLRLVLRLIYETTYCSNCREYALRQLGKRRALTDEIRRECLMDSNNDIRAYAKRLLAGRKK